MCLAERSSDGRPCRNRVQLDSISLTPLSEEQVDHSFDLSELDPGEEIVISSQAHHHGDEDLGLEMKIALKFNRQNPVLMRCSWSKPT